MYMEVGAKGPLTGVPHITFRILEMVMSPVAVFFKNSFVDFEIL